VSLLITSIIDTDRVKQTSTRHILRTSFSLLQSKYYTIQVGDRSVGEMAQAVQRTLAPERRDYLDKSITAEELHAAVRNGACNKAPGRDGICLEFFKVN
jgi:DNA-binding NarL/FixJ family response regulator